MSPGLGPPLTGMCVRVYLCVLGEGFIVSFTFLHSLKRVLVIAYVHGFKRALTEN